MFFKMQRLTRHALGGVRFVCPSTFVPLLQVFWFDGVHFRFASFRFVFCYYCALVLVVSFHRSVLFIFACLYPFHQVSSFHVGFVSSSVVALFSFLSGSFGACTSVTLKYL